MYLVNIVFKQDFKGYKKTLKKWDDKMKHDVGVALVTQRSVSSQDSDKDKERVGHLGGQCGVKSS